MRVMAAVIIMMAMMRIIRLMTIFEQQVRQFPASIIALQAAPLAILQSEIFANCSRFVKYPIVGCAIIIIECYLNRFLVSINNGVDLGISVGVTTQISVIIEAIDCKLCMKVSVYHTPIKSIYNCRRHAQLPRKSIISFPL